MMEGMVMVRWGTWEELLLGGAVLRHGIRDWDAVAAELRNRTLCPYNFTAEVCKAKYEDLQERFCGCNAWFEELRKQRVTELKRELEKSEDSIGSLESKLESLKAGRSSTIADHTESPSSIGNSEGFELSGKDTSKDGLSAGSFTEETRTNWSPESQIPGPAATTHEIKSMDHRENAKSAVVHQIIGSNVRKRRGKRKRKDCSKDSKEIKEGSVGDNEVGTSFDHHHHHRVVEESTGDVAEPERIEDLIRVLNSVEENENGSAFRRRLDNQRARYKKTIRRHMDLDSIRSRISDRTITSARELHRDLLLLCNNAMVFYPKDSREHKSAASLRDFVSTNFQKNRRVSDTKLSGDATDTQVCNPPVKPRSARPLHRKVSVEVVAPPTESKNVCVADVPAAPVKKGVGGRPGGRRGAEPAAKGKKRIRRK